MGQFSVFLAIFLSVILENSQAQQREWWERTVIYQIYPRSFRDTNCDGMGDLKGITQKLDYIKDIGIETIWVQPFYKSPMADFGYDVSDFRVIEPMFGTMDDFKNLLQGIHDRGMKLLMDMVPNHVSDEHEWFKKSVNREDPYTDYFIWANASGFNEQTQAPIVPNNWLSLFGGTAWVWNERRRQFYYRQFSTKQPDLNFRNRRVRDAFLDEMRFWLNLGVDGFRLDAVRHIFEVEDLRDEPYLSPDRQGSTNFADLNHLYTIDQPETYQLAHEWRLFIDDYSKKDNKVRIFCTEAYAKATELMKYFGNSTHLGVHFPFYFGLTYFFNRQLTAHDFNRQVRSYYDALPPHGVANWHVSNHDNPRLATRLSPQLVDAGNIIILLLPGTANVYYGDEIGMEDTPYRIDQIKDPNNAGTGRIESRDGARSPMQWDDTNNAGFTCSKVSWLPVNPDYWSKNVKCETKDPNSHLNIFKRLMELRKTPVVREGRLETCVPSDWVHVFVRNLPDKDPVVVITNLGSELEPVCVSRCSAYQLPIVMNVHTSSVNSGFKIGDRFHLTAVKPGETCSKLRPKASVVLVTGPVLPPPATSHASSSLLNWYSMITSLSLLLLNWNS